MIITSLLHRLRLVVGLLLAAQAVCAQEFDLMSMSLDELMDIEVYSAAKKDQARFEVAAALSVITREDIQRSGLTTVAELLRLAPGVQVGRIDVNKWGVSIRGFNGRFTNKLLVLVDGRSVYTPVFAGVYWRELDLLQDVERIEIVRGPGGAVWGANAVNGIVNIITRRAAETQGLELVAAGGIEERGNVGLRYGGRIGERAKYRVYAGAFDRAPSVDAAGRTATDQWHGGRLGMRLDWTPNQKDAVYLSGGGYGGSGAQTYDLPWSVEPPRTRSFVEESGYGGAHLLARWERTRSADADWAMQAYYDLHDLDDVVMSERRHTFDLEFQQRRALGARHELLWGVGYRLTDDAITGSPGSLTFLMDPADRRDQVFSAFVQDDIALGAWRLSAGSKFEHNPYTELEVQPSLRLLRRLGDDQSLWAAVSRAVRTPSRAELHTRAPSALIEGARPEDAFTLFAFRGNPDQDAENLLAYEAGYRVQPVENLFGEVAVYWNEYSDLRSFSLGQGQVVEGPVSYIEVPIQAANRNAGKSCGVEVEVDWEPHPRTRLRGGYTYLRIEVDAVAGDPLGAVDEGQSPVHEVGLAGAFELRRDVQLDLWGRYVDALPGLDIDGYFNLDVRLGWRLAPGLEVALVGQNLLAAQRPEFSPEFLNSRAAEVQRGAYLSFRWRP